MKIEKVNLYEYYSVGKKSNLGGLITCYIQGDVATENIMRPAVLVIPGGGYDHLSKRENKPVAMKFLSKGFNVFVLDYSVNTAFPQPLVEASLAMAYLRDNCEKLNIISDKIAVCGFSAGAHLSAMLGIIFDDDELALALKHIPRFNNANIEKVIKPDALILSYPVVTSDSAKWHKGSFERLSGGDNRLIDALSLENRVKPSSTPAFIWHTFNDNSVPVYNSLALALAYEKNSVPFSLHVFENGKHGLSVCDKSAFVGEEIPAHSVWIEKWIDMCVDWLKERGF